MARRKKREVTERSLVANRRNAALATGPRSGTGKAIASLNALQHGLASRSPVVALIETEEDWETHRAGVVASLTPSGGLEEALADRVASCLWRLQRIARAEREEISLGVERAATAEPDRIDILATFDAGREIVRPRDPMKVAEYRARSLRSSLLPSDEWLIKVARYEAHISRQMALALHELQRLQAGRIAGLPALPPAALDVTVSGPD